MEEVTIPVDVLVTAMTSRLADLQDARLELDAPLITTRAPQDGAGRRALVAGQLLAELEHRAIDVGAEYSSITSIHHEMRKHLSSLSEDEVRFAVRFLHTDRSIQYVDAESGDVRETRSWTRLVKYQASTDRVRMSDAGRLFMKVLRHRRDWLYEDKQVEMLQRAIQSGLFEEIPRLSIEIVSSLRMFNEHITSLRESPSLEEMAREYSSRREHYSTMLGKAVAAASAAQEDLGTSTVQSRYDASAAAYTDYPTMGALRSFLKNVLQAAESLNRNWVALLGDLQGERRAALGVFRFDQVLNHCQHSAPSLETMQTLLSGCAGWATRSSMASVSSFIGSVEHEFEPESPPTVTFDNDPNISDEAPWQSWIQFHSEALMQRLRHGPLSVSELLSSEEWRAERPSDISGMIGAFWIKEPLGPRVAVRVSCEESLQALQVLDRHVVVNRLRMTLVSERKE